MSEFWDKIRDDDELAHARRKLSFHEFRTIRNHAVEELEDLLRQAYDDAAKAGLPAHNRDLWERIWVLVSTPETPQHLSPTITEG